MRGDEQRPAVGRAALAIAAALAIGGGVAIAEAQENEAVAVDRTALAAAADKSIASGARQSDTPLRTVAVDGSHVGIGVVYRAKGQSPAGSSSHDVVTEVYQVIQGEGTLVTGGEIVNPQRRANASDLVGQVNGPGVSGTAIRGGVPHHLVKGDMIIIPAGTPHWFSEVQENIVCSVVRVDPKGVVALK